MNSKEVLDLLEWSGAIMKGHFKLTSGRHSDTYIEKFRLLENSIRSLVIVNSSIILCSMFLK